jgi:hypothetical protein
VGRTITADNGAVHVNGSGGLQVTDGSVIFDGTTGTTPAAGAGTRLMWIPATGAFRAGAVGGVEWDDVNIGGGSTVTGGADNTASGTNSVIGGGVGIGTAAPAGQLDVQGGGVVVGAPTGGDLGAGTINAEAVYDDNTLLSDYVFDYYFDGYISEEDRALHAGYRLLSLEETIEFMEREHHLPTIAGREEWNENGRMALGTLVSQIWETVETQTLYIKELKSELDELRLREQRQQQTVAIQMAELRHMRHELTSELVEIRDLKTAIAGWAYGDKLEVPRKTVATQREPHQREGL